MAPDVGIEPVLDHPLRVRPDEVEAALDNIWRESSPAGSDESTVRLRLLNFVATGAGDDAEVRFQAVMTALPAHHPCRGILATTAGGGPNVAASIGAHCWLAPGGGRHLCSEEITLTAAPGQERALASAVLALLVPEIPVAVWIIGGLARPSALVEEVATAADQLYFDSAETQDAAALWPTAVGIGKEYDIELRDLAWWRSEIWRALVAQVFDTEEAQAELRRLTSIEIVSGGTHPSAEALLVAGWLVSRLGLTIADAALRDDGVRATLYDGSRGVRLSISLAGDAAAAVRSLTIRTDHAAFVIEADAASGHMRVTETWGDQRESQRTVARPAEDDASLFASALDGGDLPSVFSDAVAAALALAGRAPDAIIETPRQPA